MRKEVIERKIQIEENKLALIKKAKYKRILQLDMMPARMVYDKDFQNYINDENEVKAKISWLKSRMNKGKRFRICNIFS